MMAGDDRLKTDAGTGWVLESKEGSALVRVLSETGGCSSGSCAGCSAGCQGGLFGEGGAGRVIRVGNPVGAAPGDMVALAARPGVRFSALTLLFVLPLVCFMAGFVLGTELVPGSDAVAVLLAFGLAGVWYGALAMIQRVRARRPDVWIAHVLVPARRDGSERVQEYLDVEGQEMR